MKKARQAAHKKEDKKRTFFLFASVEHFIGFLFFICVLSLSSWVVLTVKDWVNDPERVVLSQLTLLGDNDFTTEQDIRSAIMGLGLPNTYIGQDVDDIQQEILRLPWIKQVSVRKQWPDKLIIHVVEYKPSYVWNDTFLLSLDAEVFSVPSERVNTVGMVKLFGPIGKEKWVLDLFKDLERVTINTPNNKLKVAVIDALVDDRNAWQLTIKVCDLNNICQNIKLVLGKNDTVSRLQRFVHIFPEIQAQLSSDEVIIEADLRYENGISIKKEKQKTAGIIKYESNR